MKFVLLVALFVTAAPVPPQSLCNVNEQTVFSCATKPSGKIVSLCSSPELTKDTGYLQYRFGLPKKIELEFPQKRQQTQQAFKYSHYFRAQVDLTEISFTSNGYQYAIFDDYNGEERPARSEQGVRVMPPNNGKEVTLTCRGRAKADYSNLGEVLATEP